VEEKLQDLRGVEEDKNVDLKVKIKGNPPPTIAW